MSRPGAFWAEVGLLPFAADAGREPFAADAGRDPDFGVAAPDFAEPGRADPGRSPATDPGLLPDGDGCFDAGLDPLLAAEAGREP